MTEIPRLSSTELSFTDRLSRQFYARDPATVARALLGKWLVRVGEMGEIRGGRIVETEAYLAADDPASHSHGGLRRRNASMFGPAGTLYVYTIHAKFCMNVSTERAGIGSAVLIRALEPLWGLAAMQAARGQSDPRKLTAGPAMLCQALGITTADDAIDLIESPWLAILRGDRVRSEQIVSGPRIGISRAVELPLRFHIRGSRYASRPSSL